MALYDIELSVPTMTLSVPAGKRVDRADGAPDAHANSLAIFSWSPEARYLVGAWSGWPAGLHLFDLHGKLYLGTIGELRASYPAIWRGRIRAIILLLRRAESGRRCGCGNQRAAPLGGAAAIEIGRPIGSSRSKLARNSRRKARSKDTDERRSARTKRRSRA